MKTQQPLHVATPVRQSLALSKVAGTSVYLKLDSSQPTGSFKIRGIGHLCKTVSATVWSFTQRRGKDRFYFEKPAAICAWTFFTLMCPVIRL